MGFIPTLHEAKVVLEWSNDTLSWTNTLWFLKDSFDTDDMQDLADAMINLTQEELFAFLQEDVNYDGCKVYDMREEEGQIATGASSAFGGARTGDPASIAATCVVTMRSNSRGRSGRGRNYVSGMSELDVGDDRITASLVSDGILASYQEIPVIAQAVGWTHVIESFQHDGEPLSLGQPYIVTSYEVRSLLFGTQRRRIHRP